MIGKSAIAAIALSATVLAPADVLATTNLVFILDSSGSMWGEVDNELKIDTAKSTLSDLVADLPQDSNMGLMVYGHRREKDCTDVETVMRVGSANEDSIAAALERIAPLGRTPITRSLELSGSLFGGREQDNNYVVLISDGKANCGGDPCAAAGKLAAAGINVKVHVVGFDISPDERAQLQCIADQGKGKYFSADSTKGFKDAIKDVIELVKAEPEPIAPAPVPAPPEWTVVFEDNFDGSELAEHWTIRNPNPDAYIVENGELLLLSAQRGELAGEKNTIANMLVLDQPLPEGDWRMTMRYRTELGTVGGWTALGLFKDPGNRLQAFTLTDSPAAGVMRLHSAKISAGSQTGNRYDLYKNGKSIHFARALELRLLKKGRSYTAQGRLVSDNPDKPNQWVSLPKLTSLKPIGPLFIAFTKGEGGGEDLVHIDWVRIEQLSEAAAAPQSGSAEKKSP